MFLKVPNGDNGLKIPWNDLIKKNQLHNQNYNWQIAK